MYSQVPDGKADTKPQSKHAIKSFPSLGMFWPRNAEGLEGSGQLLLSSVISLASDQELMLF